MLSIKRLFAGVALLIASCFMPKGIQAQQVVGTSAILDVNNGVITTYSATEVDYQTSLYYEPYIEGYLFENGNLIGSGSATANTNSNCDGNISSTIAEGCIQKPDAAGNVYQIQSDHYLIAAFAYQDGGGSNYFSNPEGFVSAPEGSGPDYSSFGPGGGPTYVEYQYIYLGTTAVNGTVEDPGDNTPVLTGVQPNVWQSGQTNPGVVFSGQNFGTNPPTLNFSSGGVSYTVTSSSDTQIVADVTVAAGTPDGDIDVSITSNGNNGQGFSPTGGGQPTGGPVKVTISAPINAPEVTVIGWINEDLVSLPSGADQTIVTNLTPGTNGCFLQLGYFLAGSQRNLDNQVDRDYANAWLVKNSGNYRNGGQPAEDISPQAELDGGNWRIFAVWGGSNTKPTAQIGITPDPCQLPFPTKWLEKGQPSYYMGSTGISQSGNRYMLAEGRIGKIGQRGSETINQGRTVPYVWAAIEFDANGNFVTPPHEIFPTYSVYINGHRVAVDNQHSVSEFVLKDKTNQIPEAQPVP